MSDELSGKRVHVFEWGEADDDLRVAFYIDERSYSDANVARTTLQTAHEAMRRLGVIYSVATTAGAGAHMPFGASTWEQFRQHYFVEGAEIPVRSPALEFKPPPSWEDMNRAVETDHLAFRAYLINFADRIFPGGKPLIQQDYGPLRRSPGSIDWSEEKYGFEIALRIDTPVSDPGEATDRAWTALQADGWVVQQQETARSLVATRDEYRLWLTAEPRYVFLDGKSPLYRSPSEPGSTYLTEARPLP